MLHTPVCDLLGIDSPIVYAGMRPFTSAELVAEVSNAGALDSLGAGTRTAESLREQLARTRELTARPFQETVKVEFWEDILPATGQAYSVTPRTLSSPFVDEWQGRRDAARQEADQLRDEVGTASAHGRFGEILPFTGHTAGLIKDILPAAEIVHRLVLETEGTLKETTRFTSLPN